MNVGRNLGFRTRRGAPAALGMMLATQVAAAGVDLRRDVAFTEYSPLATTARLFSRTTSPLAEPAELKQFTGGAGTDALPEYTLDLARERFTLQVPSSPAPAAGYGLLVFIPPWPEATVPRQWDGALERTGIVFVTAARSGNDQAVIPRRMALALHAYANVVARLHVDPRRVYVGGFSGGARAAERLALAYPDVFRGAFLDGGSDPIGSMFVPLPPPERLRQAQAQLRLVFAYGADDAENAARARETSRSAADACLPATTRLAMPHHAHALADASTVLQGLRALEAPAKTAADLAACQGRLQAAATAAARRVDAAIDAAQPEQAKAALKALNASYGRFVEDDVLRLVERLVHR